MSAQQLRPAFTCSPSAARSAALLRTNLPPTPTHPSAISARSRGCPIRTFACLHQIRQTQGLWISAQQKLHEEQGCIAVLGLRQRTKSDSAALPTHDQGLPDVSHPRDLVLRLLSASLDPIRRRLHAQALATQMAARQRISNQGTLLE